MAKFFKETKNYLFVIVVISLTCWLIRNYIGFPSASLDSSWILALNWAHLKGLQWGTDIIFTYGPLAHYFLPLQDFANVAQVTIINNLIMILNTSAIMFLFFRKTSSILQQIGTLSVFVFLLIFANSCGFNIIPIELSVIVALFLTQTCFFSDDSPNHYYYLGVIFFILSSVQFVKCSFIMISWALLIYVVAFCLYRRKYTEAAFSLLAYMTYSASMWIIAGQKITNIQNYFYNALVMSSGYTEAMQLSIIADKRGIRYLLLAVLYFIIYMYYFINSIFKKKWICFFNILLPGACMFLTFKEAFVRSDEHLFYFIRILPFIGIYLLYILFYNNNWLKNEYCFKNAKLGKRVLIDFMILLVIYGFAYSFNKNPAQIYPFADWAILRENFKHGNNMDPVKQQIRDFYGVNVDTLSYISPNDKVDIIPWDISLLYAYDMNWAPRPIFQSYSAYTHYLDVKNAEYFESDTRPDKIIFSFMSIDWRYPFFDARIEKATAPQGRKKRIAQKREALHNVGHHT